MKAIFQTGGHLPGLGHRGVGSGAGQHAVARRPVLMCETGHFATLWHRSPKRLGLEVEFIPGDWRRGAIRPPDRRQACGRQAAPDQGGLRRPQRDLDRVESNIAAVRKAIDAAKHPALLLVDTISSLGSLDYRHDEWGVDVTVGRLAEGADAAAGPVSFNAVSQKAMKASETARCRAPTGTGPTC
jgi:alanine-glyoxylate transaminase/serine-glyoxylate transaminase/serine-pyruvate transaminase